MKIFTQSIIIQKKGEAMRKMGDSYYKLPPTEKELKQLKSLLYDFGVIVSVFPPFKSRFEMMDWKRKMLQNAL